MRRHRVLGLLAVLVLVGASSAAGHTGTHPYGHQGPHIVGLPDLYADAPDNISLDSYDFGGETGNRLLLRFNGYIHNRGTAGTLELHGFNRAGSEMDEVRQRQYTGSGSTWIDHDAAPARLIYETGDGHQHWHLRDAAQYSLVTPDGSGEAAPSAKVGFCFIDSEHDYELSNGQMPYVPTEWHWDEPAKPGHGNCGEQSPLTGVVVMGLTPGWRDTYPSNLWFQWVDVSRALPGPYRMGAVVDPSGWIRESDEVNPAAETNVTLPGYRARPVTAHDLPRGSSTTITLDSQQYTSLLAPSLAGPQFRIDDAPDDGTLNVPTDGTWFSGADVEYTPRYGADGSDSFRFSVRESGNPFPLSPASATASITLAGPVPAPEQVTITGAPAQLETGTGAQLQSTVSDPRGTGDVTWSVNGVPGGDDTAGRITPTGFYTAPGAPPAGGVATVRATTDTGATASVDIAIVRPPDRQPAPGTTPVDEPPASVFPPPAIAPPPGGTPRGGSTRKPARGLQVSALRSGRFVVVSLVSPSSGSVRVALFKGRSRIGRCSGKVLAARRFTCRLTVARRVRGKLVARVAYRVAGARSVTTRRIAVAARR